jgi:hypothetical protein
MRVATRYGLRVNPLIPLIYKGLSGCYDAKSGDTVDRMIALASRLTPSA